MPGKPFIIAFFAAAALAACTGVACHAADLTIASSGYARQAATSLGDKRSGDKNAFARSAKADKAKRHDKRHDKEVQRRILTYKLYQDPVFKLNGALTDKRHFGTPPALNRFGSGFGNSIPAQPQLLPGTSNVAARKLKEPESAGIDFGCSDKPFRSSAATRELTACYKHNVDRSWKTQTYLSREYTEGSQKWGGGLAVRYAY